MNSGSNILLDHFEDTEKPIRWLFDGCVRYRLSSRLVLSSANEKYYRVKVVSSPNLICFPSFSRRKTIFLSSSREETFTHQHGTCHVCLRERQMNVEHQWISFAHARRSLPKRALWSKFRLTNRGEELSWMKGRNSYCLSVDADYLTDQESIEVESSSSPSPSSLRWSRNWIKRDFSIDFIRRKNPIRFVVLGTSYSINRRSRHMHTDRVGEFLFPSFARRPFDWARWLHFLLASNVLTRT